ncbi:MAG: substrate-binding domain-containing protein [Akkermansiaceae bacterium]|nr:substrate-binding domain-containing protein [Akkermansiaceae bacterium]
MQALRRFSIVEQTADHLRQGLREGLWRGTLPGVVPLAKDLHVSRGTLLGALRLLEGEGIITVHGGGRNRTINTLSVARNKLSVGILCHDLTLNESPQMAGLLYQVRHDLEAAGHAVFFAAKTQQMLRHKVEDIKRHLGKKPADAWIVEAGSRDLLEWFAGQAVPCLALYGRSEGLPLARTGPDILPPYVAATRQLLALGHRRIVAVCRRHRRQPTPGVAERGFLDELTAHGIVTGDYHLPDWEETPAGLTVLLESLFRHTPPTALMLDEASCAISAALFLAQRRIRVPEDVSLIAIESEASLAWCHPPVAHVRWDNEPIIRRIVRWVDAVRNGRADRDTINFPARFVPTGSIGPVRME